MIDLETRQKLAEKKKMQEMFSSMGSMISSALSKNQSDLEGKIEKAVKDLLEKESKEMRITGGEDFYVSLTKYVIKRLDIQIMLLMEIHKDLKKLYNKKEGGNRIA